MKRYTPWIEYPESTDGNWCKWEDVFSLLKERDTLHDVVTNNGFVPCDSPTCNCGSWHARYGLREQMDEIEAELENAGHPLCNDNGNLPGNALRDLIAERDFLRNALEKLAGAVEFSCRYVLENCPDGRPGTLAERIKKELTFRGNIQS